VKPLRGVAISVALALALSLLGCGAGSPGESVALLTGATGCYAGGEGGSTAPLLAEPQYGTSWLGTPVMWPSGYTARRAGSEVEVLDAHGYPAALATGIVER
jgi:hypothetical protein